MKEYFTGHRDAVRINEFLNGHSEDSRDFQIVYRLRRMGERFVDGSLTLQEVEENRELLQSAQAEAMAFIQRMDGRSTRLCASSRNRALSSLLWNKGFAKRLCIHHSASLCPRARYRECGTSYSASGKQDGSIHWCTRNGGCQQWSPRCGAG